MIFTKNWFLLFSQELGISMELKEKVLMDTETILWDLSESTVFPEIDPGKIDKIQGLEVSIVTTAKDNKEGMALLEALGMPFRKEINYGKSIGYS